MNSTCGCCEGTEKLTPTPTANRPGLPALSYRVGTHATFLETMKARLSNFYLEIPNESLNEQGRQQFSRIYPLRNLKTRSSDDPAIALLDSWALVADVLTFYQERIANEGYLRTATERRSILELARLVGYKLRPGVASTTYLAYTLDKPFNAAASSTNGATPITEPDPLVTIPAGSRAQSVPGPGELPQSFETADDLDARWSWNNLKLRMSQPQTSDSIETNGLYLKGISTNLKPNDPLLIDFGSGTPEPFRVQELKPDAEANRTHVTLRPWGTAKQSVMRIGELARHFATVEMFDVDANTAMAKRVLGQLTKLEKLASTATAAEVVESLEKVLPALVDEHGIARTSQFTKLEPWLGQTIESFEAARLNLARSVSFQPADSARADAASAGVAKMARANGEEAVSVLGGILESLKTRPSIPPANASRLDRNVDKAFAARADIYPRLLAALNPAVQPVLYAALRNAKVTPSSGIKVYALRAQASLFAHNAPLQPVFDDGEITGYTSPHLSNTWEDLLKGVSLPVIALDSQYDHIKVDSSKVHSFVIIERPNEGKERTHTLHTVKSVQATTMSALGVSTKVTQLTIDPPWLIGRTDRISTPLLRGTAVYTQSEPLDLAEEPIEDPICDDADKPEPIELEGLYDGLEAGRWLIISGERSDIADTSGVEATELVMLAAVKHGIKQIEGTDSEGEATTADLAEDKNHTFIQLSDPLAYCYKRDTVKIYGNVVKATHGETRNEVIGSGDGSKALQQFTLRQPPLTFVSAANPAGVDSTLVVRVNDVQWHEADSLAGLLPTDRKFITYTDDDGKTTVVFGNGQRGARLPTGQENVTAAYRNGIGKPGNVKADQVTLLVTRPLGVKAVTNPLRASGGADKENRDQARQNAPLAVAALDRLVSTQDYADFARTFAGIGKASAARLSDGYRQLVHVTIAGAEDIPIEKTSDLYRNLVKALHDFGDPYLPIEVEVRKLLLLVIQAKVRVLPEYLWEKVEPKVRAALLDKFSFAGRDLGQDALLSEAISAIQSVEGVQFVDVDTFDGVDEQQVVDALGGDENKKLAKFIKLKRRVTARLAESETDPDKSIQPAELACFSPDVPDTIILSPYE